MTNLYAELTALISGKTAQTEPAKKLRIKPSKKHKNCPSLVRKRINGKNVYEPLYTHAEISEYEKYIKRVKAGLFLVNKTYAEQTAKNAQCGVCPKCHLILPFSGECECGYHK